MLKEIQEDGGEDDEKVLDAVFEYLISEGFDPNPGPVITDPSTVIARGNEVSARAVLCVGIDLNNGLDLTLGGQTLHIARTADEDDKTTVQGYSNKLGQETYYTGPMVAPTVMAREAVKPVNILSERSPHPKIGTCSYRGCDEVASPVVAREEVKPVNVLSERSPPFRCIRKDCDDENPAKGVHDIKDRKLVG